MCSERSLLYAHLSACVAGDPQILKIAAPARPGHSPVNLLFAAVNYLLLNGLEHPLRDFYPMLDGTGDPAHSFQPFADFCQTFSDEITDLVATRSVQTNDVGRSALLLPGFYHASRAFGQQQLHLIEVGCSAGLHLLFDHYSYQYINPDSSVQHVGSESSVALQTTITSEDNLPNLGSMPVIAGRTGIDVEPVDVNDEDAVRWVESLIWADDVQRIERFRSAIAYAQQHPPMLITGDGIAALPDALSSVGVGALPCVFHSHAIYIMDDAWRKQFHETIAALGRQRDLAHLSLEWLGDDSGPQLVLSLHRDGTIERLHLADCQQHGRWLRWMGSDSN